MTGGAFMISREIFDNDIWEDPIKLRIFLFLVGKAVFAEEGKRVAGVDLKRGQYLRSYRNLIEDLSYKENRSVKKISLSTLHRKLDALVKEDRLKVEETPLGTIFTVVNYSTYQNFDHYKKPKEAAPVQQPEEQQPSAQNEDAEKNLQALLNRFLELRGKGLNYSAKDVDAAQGILQYVPIDKAIHYLEEKFKAYKPKHNWDVISNLEYCAGYIVESYQNEQKIRSIQAGGGRSGKNHAGSANGAPQQDSITGGKVGRLRRKQS
ncbi:hypothetical protein [Jeotgalibacillus proteolyticus]|uniref:Uncharacterized protein n=1 Tax=Jeotgalibacillus proteolyticus TaxID=2082395 RepID=A0A2S5GAR8_9BACL|nr:hypothetical protein [Jeotgalibacillus proteolyticus]PPA70068.1 hypothetical protein C4B60_10780 [Jeotgalibacillus proteolyticus]